MHDQPYGVLIIMLLFSSVSCLVSAESPELRWGRLPDLPDEQGFAGMYAGVSGGALIAAGGANFERTAEGGFGDKLWYDTIYVLREPDGSWERVAATLPMPLGYGVSVTHDDSVVCVGGINADGLHADVFRLRWNGEHVVVDAMPPLPQPNAFAAGALVGDTVYIAGGVPEPGTTAARSSFLSLDLADQADGRAWRQLDTWPGPGRQTAVAAAQDGEFLLISGVELRPNADGRPAPVTPYLTDAYAYRPGDDDTPGRWRRLADVPHPVAAAPGPALPLGASRIAISGGVDGSTYNDPDAYGPFPRTIHVYDLDINRWQTTRPMPDGASRVTAPAVVWDGRYVVLSGERRPRFRSPHVYVARPASDPDEPQ